MSARSTASAMITFGLVSIPVKVYLAADEEKVSFKMLTPAGNPIRQKNFDSITNEEVEWANLDKGYEHMPDQLIRFTKEELKALESVNEKIMEVQEFVPASEISPVGVEKSYYLGPDKGGDAAYRLFAETLQAMGMVGIARWSARGRDHVIAIRPHDGGLVIQQLYFATEIRAFEMKTGKAKVEINDALRNAAATLIQSMANPTFDLAKYENGFLKRVQEAVQRKIQGITESPEEKPVVKSNVIDLLSALKASIKK